jgi:alpha-beta hydrolase superfamily lysophospholipase
MSPLFAFPFFRETSLLGHSLLWGLSWIFPDLLINNMINPTSLTNNDRRLRQCIDGVFSFQFVTFNMVQDYAALSEKVMRDAFKFKYPLFVCYGGKNAIQSKGEVKRFYQLAGSLEKSSFVFKEGFHELFKDEHAE